VSQNDFVDQLLADLTGLKVERPTSSEMTVLGAAFLAGLHEGNSPALKLTLKSSCLSYLSFCLYSYILSILLTMVLPHNHF